MTEINWQENYRSFADFLCEEADQISEDYIIQRRWCTVYEYIYKYQDKYYQFTREQPSTECQEGGDFYTSEPIEVKPVKKMVEVIEYMPVK